MKSLSKTTILIATALVFTIAAGVLYVFLFVSTRNKTESTATLLASSEELTGKESRIGTAATILKNESANIDKLSSYFIKESEIVEFAKKIEELGPQSGTILTIETLEPGLTEKTTPFLNFRVKANGKFSDVMRLLTLLENYPAIFTWKTVRLVSSGNSVQQDGTTFAKLENSPDWSVEVFLSALNFVKE